NNTATTNIYPLSLHDALPICKPEHGLKHRYKKHVSRDHGRNRVPRQAEDTLMPQPPIEEGLAWAHGDLPKINLQSFRLERARHEIAFANRRAAYGHKNIGGASSPGQRDQALGIVLGDAELHGLPASLLDQSGESDWHRGDDLVFAKFGAHWHHFIASRQDRDFRLAADRNLGMVHCRGEHQLTRSKPCAASEQNLSFLEVLSPWANVGVQF